MTKIDKDFWEDRWQKQKTGWDIGYPSPPLRRIIDGISDKNARILIPGCGNAHEAEYLVRNGFTDITLIDIAPTAVEILQEKFRKDPVVKVYLMDFFSLEGTFDYILEQTFFCALDPVLRNRYVEKMEALLRDGGVLTGVLFSKDFATAGPPFGGSKEEYISIFSEKFENIEIIDENESIKPRLGTEVFFRVTKKTI